MSISHVATYPGRWNSTAQLEPTNSANTVGCRQSSQHNLYSYCNSRKQKASKGVLGYILNFTPTGTKIMSTSSFSCCSTVQWERTAKKEHTTFGACLHSQELENISKLCCKDWFLRQQAWIAQCWSTYIPSHRPAWAQCRFISFSSALANQTLAGFQGSTCVSALWPGPQKVSWLWHSLSLSHWAWLAACNSPYEKAFQS